MLKLLTLLGGLIGFLTKILDYIAGRKAEEKERKAELEEVIEELEEKEEPNESDITRTIDRVNRRM